MNILFDFEVKYPEKFAECPANFKNACDTLRNYILTRVKVIEDEIDQEEKTGTKAIFICLLAPPYSIKPMGYSKTLIDKINNSFNENDILLMFEKVEEALNE